MTLDQLKAMETAIRKYFAEKLSWEITLLHAKDYHSQSNFKVTLGVFPDPLGLCWPKRSREDHLSNLYVYALVVLFVRVSIRYEDWSMDNIGMDLPDVDPLARKTMRVVSDPDERFIIEAWQEGVVKGSAHVFYDGLSYCVKSCSPDVAKRFGWWEVEGVAEQFGANGWNCAILKYHG